MIDLSKEDEQGLQLSGHDRTIRRQHELMRERSFLLDRLIWADGLTGDELDRLKSRFDETEIEYQMLQARLETIQ